MINNPDIVHILIDPQSYDYITIDPTDDPMRQAFINSISFFCTKEEFDLVGMDLLLDQELFSRFVAFADTKATTATMGAWWTEVVCNAKNKMEKTMKTSNEMNITMDDTGTVEAQDPRDIEIMQLRAELIRRDGEVLKEQLLQQAKKQASDAAEEQRKKETKKEETVKETSSKDFDWIDLAKTAGVAAAGAAVGAAGMWAFKKFF